MPSAPSIPRPPRQLRSRRTLERILSATERELERGPFEAISVRKIVKRARTSVGSFYARLPDKEALLPLLWARYETSLAAHLDELERSLTAPGPTLEATARLIVAHLVRLYGERPHLMRALAAYARRDPGAVERLSPTRRRDQHEFMHRALLAGARKSGYATSARTVATGLFVVDAACRERLLSPTTAHNRALDLTRDELTQELTRMLVAYFATDATTRVKPRRKE